MDDQNNQLTGRLWIPLLSNCNDLKVKISYNGQGTLNVDQITFTEALSYRFIRILGFSIFFMLIDLVFLIFFTDVKVPVKKSHAILLLIAVAVSIPFLQKSIFWGHDLHYHLLRIVSLSEGLQNGQFPVRMNTELNNGYGYPWSIYYCDIFLYPSAILYLMYVPLRICYQIYVVLINIATTAFTYLAIGKFTKKKSIKLLGTGLYVLCIYRLVNLNTRAAVGEYTAMTFLPLIIAGLYLIYTKEKPKWNDWLYLTCGMSGIIMSHVPTGEMIAVNIVLFCIILFKKTFKKDVFLSLLKATLLTIGITAWFLVPFFDYYISHVTLVQKTDLRYLKDTTNGVIFLFQLFSPGSNGHYITIGLPLILGICLILYCLKKYKTDNQIIKPLRIITGFAFLNVLFVSEYFPWGAIQNALGINGIGYKIGTLQFSWRFLSIASILLVFAIILALELLADHDIKCMRIVSVVLTGCIVVSVGYYYFKYADEAIAISDNILQTYSDTDNLYLLKGTDQSLQNQSCPEVLSGDVAIDYYYHDHGVYTLKVENQDNVDAKVSIPIYNYKYYNAYDENGVLLDKDSTDYSFISIKVPVSYKGEINIKYESPCLWRVAEVISLICIIFVVCKVFIPLSKEKLKKVK